MSWYRYLYMCVFSCRLRVWPRTSTTPPLLCCQSSLHCLTISPSTSLEMTSCVSELLLSSPLNYLFTICPSKDWLKANAMPLFSTSSVDDLQISCYRLMCSIYSLGTVKTQHAEKWVETSVALWKSKQKSLKTSFLHQFAFLQILSQVNLIYTAQNLNKFVQHITPSMLRPLIQRKNCIRNL